ncbi:cell wall metabolism sensor histidine kinase WalK [Streptococcus sp. CCH8-C6]|uniref:sensor histidine kinase n=1 Tax=Streptococcus sp. CCH8-C6 TaxID=1768777 RepID=UPI000769F924|nr:HAMP domain-containing sensor histidine kinase [Streptococcus sp. CCH8-C6]
MLNKIKKTFYADDFSYFIRYFGLFTLIFSAMTLIIIQVMRSSLYTTVDDNLRMLGKSPSSVADIAYRTTGQQSNPSNKPNSRNGKNDSGEPEHDKEPVNPELANVSSNTFALLLDDDYKNISTSKSDGFLDFNSLEFNKSYLNKIKEISISNSFGQSESYRAYLFDIDPDDEYPDIKYAVVMTSTSQLEQTSEKHEKLIAMVMVSFWGISLIASIYLARMSVKPLLESIKKQKAFVENASHELRTPLAVLQSRLETLFRKPEATIMQSSEHIASSLDEVRNMRLLTTNLLNLARRDDGINPQYGEVEPEFFDTTFANYRLIAEENQKVFHSENMVQRPVITDQILLKQLLTILFDNAIKYTEADGEISVTASSNERNLVLRVEDNGPGISNDDKKKIFDRFYRVDKARTRQKGGFGLGLSLAKQIVDAFKGTIYVKDNKPKGTVFEVKLLLKETKKRSLK